MPDGHPWARIALVKALKGCILGLVTSGLVVLVSLRLFPGVSEFDYNVGLGMHRVMLELSHRSSGLVPGTVEAGVDSYLFLDVDAEPVSATDTGASQSSACEALRSIPAGSRPAFLPPADTPIECGASRPLNRFLLAAAINEMRSRGARLIVVDVELVDGGSVVSRGETDALVQVLQAPLAKGQYPIVLAWPARYGWSQQDGEPHHIFASRADLFDPSFADASNGHAPMSSPVIAAAALPAPGQPVSRYPKCYKNDVSGSEKSVVSLPYAAAVLLKHGLIDASICHESDSQTPSGDHASDPFATPRIHYTLPSLRAHQDDTLDGDDYRIWSTYRGLYNRCLASSLWRPSSECGSANAFEGKVVVIGASAWQRRDRHYTAFGNMAGAEIVINAIRSFRVFDSEHDKAIGDALIKKGAIVALSLIPWLGYYLFRGFLYRRGVPETWSSRVIRGGASTAAFWLAVLSVLAISFSASYASFSVLVGVLAIGVEQYIEAVHRFVLHPAGRAFERVLGLHAGESDH